MLRHILNRRLSKAMMISFLGSLGVLLYQEIRAYIDRHHTTRYVLSTPSPHHLLLLPGSTDGQTDWQRQNIIVPNSMTRKPLLGSNITEKEKPILVLLWGIMYESLKLYTINNQTVFGKVEITFNSSRLDEALFVVINLGVFTRWMYPKHVTCGKGGWFIRWNHLLMTVFISYKRMESHWKW